MPLHTPSPSRRPHALHPRAFSLVLVTFRGTTILILMDWPELSYCRPGLSRNLITVCGKDNGPVLGKQRKPKQINQKRNSPMAGCDLPWPGRVLAVLSQLPYSSWPRD